MRTRSGTARKSYFLVGDSKPGPLGNASDPLGPARHASGVLLGPVKHPVQIDKNSLSRDNAGARSWRNCGFWVIPA